jgi:hypothetical protein
MILVLFMLFTPAAAPASDPSHAMITAIDTIGPQVLNIVRPAKNNFAKARIGDAVYVGDTVKTGKEMKAQIKMPDGSLVNIGPNSVFRIKAVVLKPEEAARKIVFKTFKGTVRFIIANVLPGKNGGSKPWKDSNVVVETATAVAGVRGTDFVAATDSSAPVPVVEIAVLDGVVTVRNISLPVPGSVTLSTGQLSRVKHRMGPEAASLLTEQRKSMLVEETTPEAWAMVPAKGNGNGKNDKNGNNKNKQSYNDQAFARDLAVGLPLHQVLDRAIESGLTIGEAVEAALEAGVAPYEVVYTAVSEGFPAAAVITAAVRNGARLQDVVSAALIAGAEIKAITGGAQMAAATADEVASALANALNGSAPVYGYTAPISGPVMGAGSIASPTLFPPSGATPSASPYRP